MFCIANLLDVINPQKVKKNTVYKFDSKKEWKMFKIHNLGLALHSCPPPLYFSLTLFNRKAADSGSAELGYSSR